MGDELYGHGGNPEIVKKLKHDPPNVLACLDCYSYEWVNCPACGRIMAIPVPVLVAAGVAAADAAERADRATEPGPKRDRARRLTHAFKPGQWQSFRCTCGNALQLSPSFSAPKVRCPRCRRTIHVKRQ